MLSSEDRLDECTVEAILISGHSRIPVYKGRNRCTRRGRKGEGCGKRGALAHACEQGPQQVHTQERGGGRAVAGVVPREWCCVVPCVLTGARLRFRAWGGVA